MQSFAYTYVKPWNPNCCTKKNPRYHNVHRNMYRLSQILVLQHFCNFCNCRDVVTIHMIIWHKVAFFSIGNLAADCNIWGEKNIYLQTWQPEDGYLHCLSYPSQGSYNKQSALHGQHLWWIHTNLQFQCFLLEYSSAEYHVQLSLMLSCMCTRINQGMKNGNRSCIATH